MPLTPPSISASLPATEEFLAKIEDRLSKLDHALNLELWNESLGRSGARVGACERRRRDLLALPGLREWAHGVRDRGAPGLVARRLELLERMSLDALLEQGPEISRLRNRLRSRMYRFRPRVAGRKVSGADIFDHLWKDPNRAHRKEAFYCQDSLFRLLEPSVRELVETRNETARELGFRGFAEARLALEGLSCTDLADLLDGLPLGRLRTLARHRRERYHEKTRFEEWYPWDETFLPSLESPVDDRAFPQEGMLESVLAGLRQWGISRGAFGFKLTRGPNPFVGNEIAVRTPGDVRILVDLRGGHTNYGILFHEIGHAIHSRSVRAPTHLLRCHEFSASYSSLNEGIGGVFEKIASQENWLLTRSGISRQGVRALRASSAEGMATRLVELAAVVKGELALYRNPKADVGGILSRTLNGILGFDDYAPRSWVDGFYLDTPLYNKSYLLATFFSSQILQAAVRDLGGEPWPNARMGPWLTERILAPGAIDDWIPRLQRATGRALDSGPFFEETEHAIREARSR